MLLDLGLPDINGVEVIRYAAARHPQCDVLVVTMFGDDQHVLVVDRGGRDRLPAQGRDGRTHRGEHPRTACRRLADQPGHRAPRAGALPRRRRPHRRSRPAPAAAPSPLTERETELLRLTAKGLSFETIGQLMGISPHTVVAHVKKIYRKLAVHSRGEAVYEASQMGLL